MIQSIKLRITRHLEQLKLEIEAYAGEEDLWLKGDQIPNSAGNLCLHICGNLQHYIGAVLGNTGYIRQREDEFNLQNIPKANLLAEIDKTIRVVNQTLENLDPTTLTGTYPVLVGNSTMTTEYLLIHLTSHLGYHLGQINYHRRLLAS